MRDAATPDQLQQIENAGAAGARWLLRLQNRDGGWPTFCKGWGKLPFDRSGTDLTAHAIRALSRWRNDLNEGAIDRALRRAWIYLRKHQHDDGSWTPLWFGNQLHPEEENPVYGTARVLLAYRDLARAQTKRTADSPGCSSDKTKMGVGERDRPIPKRPIPRGRIQPPAPSQVRSRKPL